MPQQLEASGASIHSLPSELLGRVLAGVDVYDRLRLDHVCRAWNAELHAGAAAAAAWHTLSLSQPLRRRMRFVEDKVCMAAWAVKHRDFVKKLTIDQGVSRELVVVLGPWLTAVESIVEVPGLSAPEWHWVMMGLPRLTRLVLGGIRWHHTSLNFLTRLTQLTSLSLAMQEDPTEDSEFVSEEEEGEEDQYIDPNGLSPLSALRHHRELRLSDSSVPYIPPGISDLSNLLYLEFNTDKTPRSTVLPSLTRLTQLQALVLTRKAVDVGALSHDSGLTRLVNLRVLMVNSQMNVGHDFTNSFAAFHMSWLQVLDLSLPGSSRLPTHWLAPMHQLRVLAVCSTALVGALPALVVPLLKILFISKVYANDLPCTQPALHIGTLPSVLDRMQSPNPLTVVCRDSLVAGKMPAAQVRTLSSTVNFFVIPYPVPDRMVLNSCGCKLPPGMKQLCNQLPYLSIPCWLN